MSLLDYEPISSVDPSIIAEIELHAKAIEILILKHGKDSTFKKHALIRLLEAAFMAKESIKRETIETTIDA